MHLGSDDDDKYDGSVFYVPFNIIQIILRRWKCDNDWKTIHLGSVFQTVEANR